MNYQTFKTTVRNLPYFTTAAVKALGASEKTLLNQLDAWTKRGLVVRLKRGIFTLSSDERRVGLSQMLIANTLYSPSYISMEFALSHHGMIPEAVFAVTSISPKKTQTFMNPLGRFLYQSVRKNVFFGFESVKDEFGMDCLMACPEKALLDYLYLNMPTTTKDHGLYFEEHMRLQNEEILKIDKAREYAARMNERKCLAAIETLGKWIRR